MFTSYTIALFSHLLGVLLFVSGIVLAGAPFEIARRREDPHEIAVILGLARAGVALVGAGAIILLGFGLWLVHLDRFGYGTSWVVAALSQASRRPLLPHRQLRLRPQRDRSPRAHGVQALSG